MQKVALILKIIFGWLRKAWRVTAQVIGSIILFFVILGVIIGSSIPSEGFAPSSASQSVLRSGGEDLIGVVNITGTIVDVSDQSGFGFDPFITSSRNTAKLFDAISRDESVKAVVLRINSPGGAVVASDDLYRSVAKLAEEKPVVAQLGDVAASGGYYVAVGADEILANPATITGSIGVIAQFPKLSGLYEKVGLEMRTFKSGEFKDIGSESRDMSPEEEAILQGVISESYDQFVSRIVEGRELDEGRVRELADGRIYTGAQAHEVGLIDDLGGFDEALERAEWLSGVEDATVVEYGHGGFLDSFLGVAADKANPFSKLGEALSPLSPGLYYLWGV